MTDHSAGAAPFHLAIPVDDLTAAKRFYGGVLGLAQGRYDTRWVDWSLYGHQLVTHEVSAQMGGVADPIAGRNLVDGHEIPVPHFGVVLSVSDFHDLADRLRAAEIVFVLEPYVRFEGDPGEQWTMFFTDPAGNALEFKAFVHIDQLFAR